jgi:capsular exopolysaccharide synthesis family protein
MKRLGIYSGDGRPQSAKPVAQGDKRKPLVQGVPLGQIIPRKLEQDPHLIIVHRPGSPIAERYRRLRLRIDQEGEKGPGRQVIVVTSAVPAEGKTTNAMNLALAMAEDRDRRTLLIDADLRRPAVTRYITPAPTLGLSEVLTGEVPLEHAIIEALPTRLSILPAGAPSMNPLELLQSEYLAGVFAELRQRYDRIIVDTPPTVPFTDAAILNSVADGAILVVRARMTSRSLVNRACASLSTGTLLGVVLNDVHYTPVDRYYYQYDDYNPRRYSRSSGAEEKASS